MAGESQESAGLPVTVESAAGPSWRGRVVGTTRNGAAHFGSVFASSFAKKKCEKKRDFSSSQLFSPWGIDFRMSTVSCPRIIWEMCQGIFPCHAHQVWVEALDPSSWRNGREAKGIFQFDKVRMEKQSLEEALHFLGLSREWGNGMIVHFYYRSSPHSLLRTNTVSFFLWILMISGFLWWLNWVFGPIDRGEHHFPDGSSISVNRQATDPSVGVMTCWYSKMAIEHPPFLVDFLLNKTFICVGGDWRFALLWLLADRMLREKSLPSGKHTKNYGTSRFLMGKFTKNCHFPEGRISAGGRMDRKGSRKTSRFGGGKREVCTVMAADVVAPFILLLAVSWIWSNLSKEV